MDDWLSIGFFNSQYEFDYEMFVYVSNVWFEGLLVLEFHMTLIVLFERFVIIK